MTRVLDAHGPVAVGISPTHGTDFAGVDQGALDAVCLQDPLDRVRGVALGYAIEGDPCKS